MEDKRVEVFIPRGADREDPNLFVGINGVNYLLPKGKTSRVPPEVAEEIDAAKGAIAKLGGRILRIDKPSSNNDESYNGHVLVVVEKIAKTPKEYPRKAGTPGKDPLK